MYHFASSALSSDLIVCAKNVTSPTGGSNWPPMIQKNVTPPTRGSNLLPLIQRMWRHQQGDPSDILWSRKRYVTAYVNSILHCVLSSLSIFQELLWSDWCDGIVVALVYCQRRILQNLRLTCSIRCSCMSRPVRFCETGWAGKFLLTCCQTSPLS